MNSPLDQPAVLTTSCHEWTLTFVAIVRLVATWISGVKVLGPWTSLDEGQAGGYIYNIYCRLHSMQRIHLKHHMSRGHRDIAFSLHLVIDLGRFHFHCPFSIQEWVGIL